MTINELKEFINKMDYNDDYGFWRILETVLACGFLTKDSLAEKLKLPKKTIELWGKRESPPRRELRSMIFDILYEHFDEGSGREKKRGKR